MSAQGSSAGEDIYILVPKTPPHLDEPVEGQDGRSHAEGREYHRQDLQNVGLVAGEARVHGVAMVVAECPALERHLEHCTRKGVRERCHHQLMKS